jgi:UDP-glucose 4-epimerase
MRVAVTGARGFLGRHLLAVLRASGDTVVPIGRDDQGHLVSPRAERADALVHLAFATNPVERRSQPLETLLSIVRGTTDAIEIARELGAAHLLLASSGKVYGWPDALPIADGSPTRPTTQLGELKLLAEGIFSLAARTTGVSATLLRVFNAYGAEQPAWFLLPTLLEGVSRGELVLGELDHARDWVHVTDVARAFVTALRTPPEAGAVRAWNVASGEAHSARDLVDLLRRAGLHVPTPQIDPARLRTREAPVERAACEGLRGAGWTPQVALEAGIAGLVTASGVAS